MSEASVFQLHRVRKQYGGVEVLEVEALDLPAGEILCMLGPTGAGKSTLLRLLAAVERPTAGEIRFRDQSLHSDSLPLSVRRQITMVFQRPVLLTGTVKTNVEYGLKMREKRNASGPQVDRILEMLGLVKMAEQSAQTLSGGQRQLVALARALVLKPDVLLLDEPTANLDPAHVALVERVIQEEFQQRQMSLIWATHNLFQAQRVANRVALMLDGRFIEVASTEVFFDSPSDSRAKDFVSGKIVY